MDHPSASDARPRRRQPHAVRGDPDQRRPSGRDRNEGIVRPVAGGDSGFDAARRHVRVRPRRPRLLQGDLRHPVGSRQVRWHAESHRREWSDGYAAIPRDRGRQSRAAPHHVSRDCRRHERQHVSRSGQRIVPEHVAGGEGRRGRHAGKARPDRDPRHHDGPRAPGRRPAARGQVVQAADDRRASPDHQVRAAAGRPRGRRTAASRRQVRHRRHALHGCRACRRKSTS